MDMDNLPEDLLFQILSYLPFPFVIRARTVCRRWRSILTSPPFFVLWSYRCFLYNSTEASANNSLWLLLPHGHGHGAFSILNPLSSRIFSLAAFDSRPFSVLASSHGALVCVSSFSSSDLIFLFNPLTQRTLSLPSPNIISRILFLGIQVHHQKPKSFSILACGYVQTADLNQELQRRTQATNPSYGGQVQQLTQVQNPNHGRNAQINRQNSEVSVEFFDSDAGSWNPVPPPSTPLLDPRAPVKCTQNFVFWDGKFCVIASDRIITYESRTETWSSIALPTWPRIWNNNYLTLHVIREKLVIEGNFQEQGDYQRRFPLRVGVVQYQPDSGQWLELGFMPKSLSDKLGTEIHPVHSIYTSHSAPDSDHLCFVPCSRTANSGSGVNLVVAFHTVDLCWSSMAFDDGDDDTAFLYSSASFKGLTLQPNLSLP